MIDSRGFSWAIFSESNTLLLGAIPVKMVIEETQCQLQFCNTSAIYIQVCLASSSTSVITNASFFAVQTKSLWPKACNLSGGKLWFNATYGYSRVNPETSNCQLASMILSFLGQIQYVQLAMFYKIHHGLVAVDKDKYIKQSSRVSRHSHNQAYEIPKTGPDYYNFSFFPHTINDWNRLPQSVIDSKTIDFFKNAIV